MTLEQLTQIIQETLNKSINQKQIKIPKPPKTINIERPKNRIHGDWSTNIAMQLAKEAHAKPLEIANTIKNYLEKHPLIQEVNIAGPGFINITISSATAAQIIPTILKQKNTYGTSNSLKELNINLEFVSANPTGPIHLGGTRWAALGDSLARILASQGAQITKEYYFNDHGTQIDRFTKSLIAAALNQKTPQDGYNGEYIKNIAQQITTQNPNILQSPQDKLYETFRQEGVEIMFKQIKQSLHEFRVDFDIYFHEDNLHKTGAVNKTIEELKANNNLYYKDNAWWLKSTKYGDDKDRVVIKSDGNPAYIAGDLAYFKDKYSRGHNLTIYMLGADHHGYISRLKAAAAAFGKNPDMVEVLLGQLVNLVSNGKPIKMSKRSGNVITMEDLVAAVGVDAARYSLSRYSANSNLDIDLDLITKNSNENPVFYVQYAHARSCSVEKNMQQLNIQNINIENKFDGNTLNDPTETELLAKLNEYPTITKQAAQFREPHRIARYLEALAGAYHSWFATCRVIPLGNDPITSTHISRLNLNNATRQVLSNGLYLLGVTAPERM